MSGVDERARHDLYRGLEELLGTARADTMMSMLPGVGRADVATKHDVALLKDDLRQLEDRIEARLDARFARVDARFASVDLGFASVDGRFDQVDMRFSESEARLMSYVDRALRDQTRTLTLGLVGAMFTMTSVSLGAIALAV